jgi:hypothetical protein
MLTKTIANKPTAETAVYVINVTANAQNTPLNASIVKGVSTFC